MQLDLHTGQWLYSSEGFLCDLADAIVLQLDEPQPNLLGEGDQTGLPKDAETLGAVNSRRVDPLDQVENVSDDGIELGPN